jgi:hypothetical protein
MRVNLESGSRMKYLLGNNSMGELIRIMYKICKVNEKRKRKEHSKIDI